MNSLDIARESVENAEEIQVLDKTEKRAGAAFPLSELQQAYWIGEEGGLRLSTPAVVYRSYFAAELDLVRLTRALRTIFERHPMLRSRVTDDGRQAIADSTPGVDPEPLITCTNWAGSDEFDPDRMWYSIDPPFPN